MTCQTHTIYHNTLIINMQEHNSLKKAFSKTSKICIDRDTLEMAHCIISTKQPYYKHITRVYHHKNNVSTVTHCTFLNKKPYFSQMNICFISSRACADALLGTVRAFFGVVGIFNSRHICHHI